MRTGECQSQRVSRENVIGEEFFSWKLICYLCTEEEKEAVFKHLSSFVRERRFPGKLDFKNCILKANSALDGRDWHAVKYFVKNQIDIRERGFLPLRMAKWTDPSEFPSPPPPVMTALNTLLTFNPTSCKDNKKQQFMIIKGCFAVSRHLQYFKKTTYSHSLRGSLVIQQQVEYVKFYHKFLDIGPSQKIVPQCKPPILH